MTIKKASSIIVVGIASGIISLPFVSAVEMNDQMGAPMKKETMMMKDDMKKADTMMDDGMKKSAMASDSMMMYEKITPVSSKEDITKIQMMLVEKGHLVMPEGVAYGYYGKRTKAAYAKHKKMSMMKDAGMMKTDTMKKDSMMMKDDMKKKEEGAMLNKGDTMKKDNHAMMIKAGSYESYESSKVAMASATHKVVLFFKASWCPTCIAVDKDIKASVKTIPENLTILDVNYDDSSELKKKYGVTYQHTFVQVDAQGNLIKKWSGSPTLVSLISEVK